jgi:hypothetical protein
MDSELDALVLSIEKPERLNRIVEHAGRPPHVVRHQLKLIGLVAAGRLSHPAHGFFAPAGFTGPIRAAARGEALFAARHVADGTGTGTSCAVPGCSASDLR